MSELSKGSYSTILDIVKEGNSSNNVSFTISEYSTGADVVATLSYLNPNSQECLTRIMQIMDHRMKHNELLKNSNIYLDNIGEPASPQARIVSCIALGDAPTVDDIVSALNQVYSSEIAKERLVSLFKKLIDNGLMANVTIKMSSCNEFSLTTDSQIVNEMDSLTNIYLKDEDF